MGRSRANTGVACIEMHFDTRSAEEAATSISVRTRALKLSPSCVHLRSLRGAVFQTDAIPYLEK